MSSDAAALRLASRVDQAAEEEQEIIEGLTEMLARAKFCLAQGKHLAT